MTLDSKQLFDAPLDKLRAMQAAIDAELHRRHADDVAKWHRDQTTRLVSQARDVMKRTA